MIKRILLTEAAVFVTAAFAFAQNTTAKEDYSSEKISLLKDHAKSQIHFVPLEIGEISPEGWIRDWAGQARDGITGHLDEYQPVFMHGWKGYGFEARGANPADGTGWPIEQCSYWLDGADTFIWWKDASIVRDWFNNWGLDVDLQLASAPFR